MTSWGDRNLSKKEVTFELGVERSMVKVMEGTACCKGMRNGKALFQEKVCVFTASDQGEGSRDECDQVRY